MLLTLFSFTSFAILIRVVANPLSNVFQKQLTQRSAEPLFIISSTYGFLALACLAFWPQLRFTGLSAAFWQSTLTTGLLAAIGNVLLVKALCLGDLSVLGPINAYKSVVGIVGGIFLLNEIPNLWGLMGIFLIISGSYIVLANQQQLVAPSWTVFGRPEIRLRLLALVFSAIDGVFLKKSILLSTPTIAFLLVFVWLCLYPTLDGGNYAYSVAAPNQTFPESEVYLLALFIAVGVTQMASNMALARIPVGYALALFQTSALVSVFFGYQFFGEQGIIRKLIGAGVMTVGAALITLLG